jgi:CDP-diacylglycerol--serine O-phosphatidyltransferase
MKYLKSLSKHIPNLITAMCLLMGCLSIVYAFQGRLMVAAVLIFIAGVFDFCDGLAARLLNAGSEFGKMLDSLADAVSFGVAPAAIMFQLLSQALYGSFMGSAEINIGMVSFLELLVLSSAFVIAIFSVLRLAKFNLDERQTHYFMGVPTPANAFLIASLPFVLMDYEFVGKLLLQIYVLVPLIFILSFLLVSEIPIISLKFKNLSFRDNRSRYILLVISLILLILLKISAYPIIFILYIVLSLVDSPQKKHQS